MKPYKREVRLKALFCFLPADTLPLAKLIEVNGLDGAREIVSRVIIKLEALSVTHAAREKDRKQNWHYCPNFHIAIDRALAGEREIAEGLAGLRRAA